jgi:hypothetical protein
MNTFIPAAHPRADTGVFVDKSQSAPESTLTADRTPGYPDARALSARVTLERWDDFDNAITVGHAYVDLRDIFDSRPLTELPTENDSTVNDYWFEEAIDTGRAERHEGPTTTNIDERDLTDYITARGEAAQFDAITAGVIPSPSMQHQIVGKALSEAYAIISVPSVIGASGAVGRDVLFLTASSRLRETLDQNLIEYEAGGDAAPLGTADLTAVEDLLNVRTNLSYDEHLTRSALIAHHLATRAPYVNVEQVAR